jgi:hypothetical protein
VKIIIKSLVKIIIKSLVKIIIKSLVKIIVKSLVKIINRSLLVKIIIKVEHHTRLFHNFFCIELFISQNDEQ